MIGSNIVTTTVLIVAAISISVVCMLMVSSSSSSTSSFMDPSHGRRISDAATLTLSPQDAITANVNDNNSSNAYANATTTFTTYILDASSNTSTTTTTISTSNANAGSESIPVNDSNNSTITTTVVDHGLFDATSAYNYIDSRVTKESSESFMIVDIEAMMDDTVPVEVPTKKPTRSPTRKPGSPTRRPTARPTSSSNPACVSFSTYDAIDADIANIKNNIADAKSRSHFLGGIVRLAAHDFMDYDRNTPSNPMGPDGCFDVTHASNNGLSSIWCSTCQLTLLHKQKYSHISKADFWIASANAVIRQTSVNNALNLRSTFKWGRKDASSCSGSGNRLPTPTGCTSVESVFLTRMGLSWRDAAVLMGGHTLGRGESTVS
jgi:hypothetical protein